MASLGHNELSMVMFLQDKPEHLDMIDGVIDKLLEEKWKTFARYRWLFIGRQKSDKTSVH